MLPLQHPLGHDAASHTHWPLLVLQASPLGHDAHAAPPAPHSALVSLASATHALPLQQPLEHDAASQTHAPAALHAWPLAHPPHVAPAVPHWPSDCDA